MKNFLRENMMIVVSIALPLLVVLFFALASVLPGLFSTPPAYDLLLSLQSGASDRASPVKIKLVVKDQQLEAVVVKSSATGYNQNPRLFRYHHETGEISEVDLPVPDNIDEGSAIPVAALAGLKVSDSLRAPDGYEFRGRRRGGGFMLDLFGGSRNRNDVSIEKNGAIVRLRLPVSDYWYNDVRFVGWLLGRED